VKPFDGHASKTFEEVINRDFSRKLYDQLSGHTPGLLILDSDSRTFDPSMASYVFISLRDSMDAFGNVKLFEVEKLFKTLILASRQTNLFDWVQKYLGDQKRARAASTGWEHRL
jgi:hypothetical protein